MDKTLIVKDLKIDSFRGLNNLEIDNLSRVNIFVGANNCGKTSVLEAIKLLGAPHDIGQIVAISLQRIETSPRQKKQNLVNYLLNLFQRSNDDQNYYHITLGGTINGVSRLYEIGGSVDEIIDSSGTSRKTFDIALKSSSSEEKNSYSSAMLVNGSDTKFVSPEKPVFESQYIHSRVGYYASCVKYLSDYILDYGKTDILNILQSFDSNIDDLSIVGEDIYLHNRFSGSLPLFAYGSGLQKAAYITIAIAYCKNGVILVDEIDNAIHVSAFKEVFGWFLDACMRWNVQAFITTHSAEAIDAILKVAHLNHPNEDMLRVITLRKDYESNITRKKIRSGQEAYEDRSCFEMELRI